MKGIGTEFADMESNVSFDANALVFIPNSPLLTIFVFPDEIVFVVAVSDIFQRCGTGGSDTDAAALPLVRNDNANLIVAQNGCIL